MRNWKPIVLFVIAIFLVVYVVFTGNCGGRETAVYKESPALETNIRDEYIKTRVEEKFGAKEYQGQLSMDDCRQKIIDIQNGHLGDIKTKEDKFRKKYQDILDFYVKLKEIKFNLRESKKKIQDLITQIESLKNLREDKKKVKQNSSQIFKQSLGAIPGYYILLGKKKKLENSRESVKEEIRNRMAIFLENQESVFDIESETEMHGDRIETDNVKRLVIRTSVPDSREDAFEKDGYIYMYKVYKVYPYYQSLEKVNFDNITTYRISEDGVSMQGLDANIKVVNISKERFSDSAVTEILNFFEIDVESFHPRHKSLQELVNGVKSNMESSQEEIVVLYNEFEKKRMDSRSSIERIENRLEHLITTLEDKNSNLYSDLEKNIDQLLEHLDRFSQLETNEDFSRFESVIKEEKENIKNELKGNILRSLKDDRNTSIDLGKIGGHISGVTGAIDRISDNIRESLAGLTRGRTVEYLRIGKQKEDTTLDALGNFEKAALDAFQAMKKEKASSIANIIQIDKQGNISFYKAVDYYKKGKIVGVDIPFMADVVKKDESDFDTHEYVVALKSKVVFDLKDSDIAMKEKGDVLLDPKHNLAWTRDYPGHRNFVIFEPMEGEVSVGSTLEMLKENNPHWRLVTKKDLDIVLVDQKLFAKVGLQYNRNYWTFERNNQYYKTYKFVMHEAGSLELVHEYRASDDGAYCLFVRRKQQGEEYGDREN